MVDAVSRFGQSVIVPKSVTFTTANWMYPQPLAVSALDDQIAEPVHVDSIWFRLTSSDAAYAGTAKLQLAHTITDNDPGTDLEVIDLSSFSAVPVNQQFEGLYRVTNDGPAASSGATFTIAPMSE